jgi:hypothetical protein
MTEKKQKAQVIFCNNYPVAVITGTVSQANIEKAHLRTAHTKELAAVGFFDGVARNGDKARQAYANKFQWFIVTTQLITKGDMSCLKKMKIK